MTAEINVVEIPSLLQNKVSKKITFTNVGINIEKPSSFFPPTFIPSENINAFRYRVTWLRGYRYIFGRQYVIEMKDFSGKVFKIKLNSFYGIRRETYYEVWNQVLQRLWDNYFSNMLNYYIDLYDVKQTFELGGIKFNDDGISWDKKNKLLWKEIALSNYKSYFMIHHINNPKQHKSCSFSMDWNAYVLQCLLKTIISQSKVVLEYPS